MKRAIRQNSPLGSAQQHCRECHYRHPPTRLLQCLLNTSLQSAHLHRNVTDRMDGGVGGEKEVPEFLKKNETLVLIPKKTFLHISQVFRTTRYNLGLISLLPVAATASPLMTSWQLTLSINLGIYELPVGFSGCCLLLIQWSPLGTRSANFDFNQSTATEWSQLQYKSTEY